MRFAVLGATGHTGRLVVDALTSRGAEVRACGRNEPSLAALRATIDGLETRRVEVHDASAVRDALRGVDGVINLAGPFLATGDVPIQAAIREGIPYVDTTGEQAFIKSARHRYHSRALSEGTAVVNALAFEYAFGDLAARAFLPEGGDTLEVLYRSPKTQGSAGTKKSILRMASAPQLGFEHGELVATRLARYRRVFDTCDGPRDAMSFPGGEPLTVPRHTPFDTVRTYIAAAPRTITMARAFAPATRLLLRGPLLRAAEARVDRRHTPPENTAARGEIHLVATTPGVSRHITVSMGDPYAATAIVAAEGILRLATGSAHGVLSPAEAFEARGFLDRCGRQIAGFEVEGLN